MKLDFFFISYRLVVGACSRYDPSYEFKIQNSKPQSSRVIEFFFVHFCHRHIFPAFGIIGLFFDSSNRDAYLEFISRLFTAVIDFFEIICIECLLQ